LASDRVVRPAPISGFPEWLPEVRRVEQSWSPASSSERRFMKRAFSDRRRLARGSVARRRRGERQRLAVLGDRLGQDVRADDLGPDASRGCSRIVLMRSTMPVSASIASAGSSLPCVPTNSAMCRAPEIGRILVLGDELDERAGVGVRLPGAGGRERRRQCLRPQSCRIDLVAEGRVARPVLSGPGGPPALAALPRIDEQTSREGAASSAPHPGYPPDAVIFRCLARPAVAIVPPFPDRCQLPVDTEWIDCPKDETAERRTAKDVRRFRRGGCCRARRRAHPAAAGDASDDSLVAVCAKEAQERFTTAGAITCLCRAGAGDARCGRGYRQVSRLGGGRTDSRLSAFGNAGASSGIGLWRACRAL